MKPIYFPNLNGIRAIAALAVLVHHSESFKAKVDLPNINKLSFIQNIGGQGVALFFTLSGFLITYLLLEEKKQTKTIYIKKFYIRRILRIWSLYYLIFILGFFVLSHLSLFEFAPYAGRTDGNVLKKTLFYILMLPNLALAAFPSMLFIGVLWSIGTEEQFYFIWPQLLKHLKVNIYLICVLLIIGIFSVRHLWEYLFQGNIRQDRFNMIHSFLYMLSLEYMAMGAVFAAILHEERKKIIKICFHPITQLITYILLFMYVFSLIRVPPLLRQILLPTVFGNLILNFAANPKRFFSLENKVFNFLGRISYGLYLYHCIMIVLTMNLLKLLNISNPYVYNLIYYPLILLLSILISHMSYQYFEKQFLKLKHKFTVINNRN